MFHNYTNLVACMVYGGVMTMPERLNRGTLGCMYSYIKSGAPFGAYQQFGKGGKHGVPR